MSSDSLHFTRYWVPVLFLMGTIFLASSIPGTGIPSLFPMQDFVFHFCVYLVLAYLFIRALKGSFAGIGSSSAFIISAAFTAFYGVSDEFHQLFVACRTFSGLDIFVDSIGGVAGSLLYPKVRLWPK